MEQTIGYCTSRDGTRIAYAVSGNGPVLVRPGTFATHIAADVDSTLWGHWWRDLSREYTLVRYDPRGVGLSQRAVGELAPEPLVDDLEAVVDALQLSEFDILGHSLGGKIGALFAADNPSRVRRLVLLNCSVEGTLFIHLGDRDHEMARERRALLFESWASEAARTLYASWLVPDSTVNQLKAIAALLGESVDTAAAMAMARPPLVWGLDEVLQRIKAPTLVMHSTGNELLPPESGREIAGKIANSRLVELDGRNHILTASERAWPEFLSHLREFLGDEPPGPAVGSMDVDAAVALGLTRREAEVLSLICDGATDLDIARALGIERPTATNHVRSIQQKTGSKNRAHAVAWAARGHLL